MTSKPNNSKKSIEEDSAASEFNGAFDEATVVRPRSVLDEAFDAHTVVRPSAKPTLPTAAANTAQNPGEIPPPPPLNPQRPQAAPAGNRGPAWPQLQELKLEEQEITHVGAPPAAAETAPFPTAPTAAELEAQALAIAQERARLKAQQAAEQAMQKAAAAQAEANRRAVEDAARETAKRQQQADAARKADEAAREMAKRQQQAAIDAARRAEESAKQLAREAALENVVRRENSEALEPLTLETNTNTNIPMEPAQRKLPWKWIATAAVAGSLGLYLMSSPSNVPKQDDRMTESASVKDSTKSVESSSAALKPADVPTEAPVEATGGGDVRSMQTVLSAFDDAFSRSQVRARPESQE